MYMQINVFRDLLEDAFGNQSVTIVWCSASRDVGKPMRVPRISLPLVHESKQGESDVDSSDRLEPLPEMITSSDTYSGTPSHAA